MSIDNSDIDELPGRDVLDPEDQKIGLVGEVFLDDVTGRPEWVTVKTGLFGTHQSFVPLDGAELSRTSLRVAYLREMVKDAPREDTNQGHLSGDQESELYRYYGLSDPQSAQTRLRRHVGTGQAPGGAEDADVRDQEDRNE